MVEMAIIERVVAIAEVIVNGEAVVEVVSPRVEVTEIVKQGPSGPPGGDPGEIPDLTLIFNNKLI